jgi:hypothetical protein
VLRKAIVDVLAQQLRQKPRKPAGEGADRYEVVLARGHLQTPSEGLREWTRGADLAHHRHATRRAVGLEAGVVDHEPMRITALDRSDPQSTTIAVVGLVALLIAKLHKLGEWQANPRRMVGKDVHDIYRLLVANENGVLAARLGAHGQHPLAGAAAHVALRYLSKVFVSRGSGLGAAIAGRAEELIGMPASLTAAATALSGDLLASGGDT